MSSKRRALQRASGQPKSGSGNLDRLRKQADSCRQLPASVPSQQAAQALARLIEKLEREADELGANPQRPERGQLGVTDEEHLRSRPIGGLDQPRPTAR